MHRFVIAVGAMMLASTTAPFAQAGGPLKVKDLAECTGFWLQVERPAPVTITFPPGGVLGSGVSFWAANGKVESAFFLLEGVNAESEYVYRLTGRTTQFGCALDCTPNPAPSLPDVETWVDDTVAAMLRADLLSIDFPPICEPE